MDTITSLSVDGVTDAQVALLAVIAAVLTYRLAVWGVRAVLEFFQR